MSIVDYKTDNVATAEDAAALLRERYAVQGAFYRRALEHAGLTVKRVNFLFLRPGCLLEV